MGEQGSKIGEDWKPISGLQSYHPFHNQITPGDKAKAGETVSILKKYHSQLSKQAEEMESKVKALEAQIEAAYGTPSLQKSPYHLHSMCVHDGNATSGHYYTFIYDRF